MKDLWKDLSIAREAAQAAAKIIKERFGETANARVKGGAKGLVTDVDMAADKAILDILRKNSEYGIISEESGASVSKSGPVWVVDPLDGTNNFARSLPLFVVSIGLMNGRESLLGVIIDPVQNKEYYAVKGNGAFCNDEKIIVPEFDSSYSPMLFLNHGYSQTARDRLKKLVHKMALSYNLLKLGTTALEMCYVAEGKADGLIFSGDELWDYAAGIVIAQEAGHIFSDWNGNPWDGKNDCLMVVRPEIHRELVELVRDL